MKKTIRVRIFNNEYLIRSDEDEELVQDIAQFVNDRFKEIKENTEGLSEGKTAILAAFEIASDYFQLRKERDNLVQDIQDRARTLNYQIATIVG